jgi:hypothetical protein
MVGIRNACSINIGVRSKLTNVTIDSYNISEGSTCSPVTTVCTFIHQLHVSCKGCKIIMLNNIDVMFFTQFL